MTKYEVGTDLATCQICGRSIKAGKGVIAHHGYSRPYEGWQTASCAGARYLPFEQSCDRLREVIEEVVWFLEKQEQELKNLLETPPDELVVYEKRGSWTAPERKVYAKPANLDLASYRCSVFGTYEEAYDRRKHHYERTIRATKLDLETMRKRLADWCKAES